MSKFLKVISAVILSLALCLTLVGCGDGGGDKGDALVLFVNNGNYYEGSVKDSVWKQIEEKAGVEFSVIGAAHGGSYYTMLSPLMNTLVDAPDICFVVPGSADLTHATFTEVWCKQDTGLVYSFEEMLAQFPEGTFPYIEKILYNSQYKNIMQNGKHHLLPNPSSANSWGIYYRTDWLIEVGYYEKDEQGNPILDENNKKIPHYPQNMDEFTEVLKLFSGLGGNTNLRNTADRTYGWAPISAPHGWHPIYHAFGVTPDWDIYDGQIDYMYSTPKFRNFLAWARDMYSKGYIYPTFNELPANGDRELFYNGQIGVLITNAESHVQYIMNKMTNLGVGDCVGFGPAPEGTETIGEPGSKGFSDWGGYWGGFTVSRTCTNIKGALSLLNFLYSPEGIALRNYGIENVHYTVDEDGKIIPNIDNRLMEGNAFEEYSTSSGEMLPSGRYKLGVSFGLQYDWSRYDGSTIPVKVIAEAIDQTYTKLVQDALDHMVHKTTKLVNFTAFPTATVAAMSEYADLTKTYVNSVIIGKAGYSLTEWDGLISTLKGKAKSTAMFSSMKNILKQYGIME